MEKLLKKLPEYLRVGNQNMTRDEAIELWLKEGVTPEEIKKQLMVCCMLSPLRLRRLYKELDLD